MEVTANGTFSRRIQIILKSMLIDDNLDTSTAVTGRPLPCWWDVEGGRWGRQSSELEKCRRSGEEESRAWVVNGAVVAWLVTAGVVMA